LSFLLDTNVVSELRRRQPSAHVLAWYESTVATELHLSVLVLGEVRRGIERLRVRDPAQARVLERWLAELRSSFADRILAVDAAIAEEWGRIGAPSPVPPEDGLMAASAKVHGLIFVTRNVAHVARTGVRVLNPWETQPV
jgi:predicted nucleic acid-binding protein